MLIKTVVETPRYTGAVYRASGWLRGGTTQGRGRYDRDKLYDKPRKDVWHWHLKRELIYLMERVLPQRSNFGPDSPGPIFGV